MKKAYMFDDAGYFVGESIAQIDPLETKAEGREIFIMPANSTEIMPPPEKDGFKRKWNGSEWIYEEIPTEKEEQREKTQEEKENEIRAIRNFYLFDTDKFLSVPDFPITEEEKGKYREYRQYLRDYPETRGRWYEQNPLTFEEWKEKVDGPSEVVNE